MDELSGREQFRDSRYRHRSCVLRDILISVSNVGLSRCRFAIYSASAVATWFQSTLETNKDESTGWREVEKDSPGRRSITQNGCHFHPFIDICSFAFTNAAKRRILTTNCNLCQVNKAVLGKVEYGKGEGGRKFPEIPWLSGIRKFHVKDSGDLFQKWIHKPFYILAYFLLLGYVLVISIWIVSRCLSWDACLRTLHRSISVIERK